jgi:hypothetical protein
LGQNAKHFLGITNPSYVQIDNMKELGMDFIEVPEMTYDRKGLIPAETVFALLNTTDLTQSLIDPENMWLFSALYETDQDQF